MPETIIKDQQTVWTYKDYAQIADWIGTFANGATIRDVERHFSGCGQMRHRLQLMRREGIVKVVPMERNDTRRTTQMRYVYVQLRRIEPKDKPLPRGQGSSMLSKFSTPVQRPSEMQNNAPITPMPIVKVDTDLEQQLEAMMQPKPQTTEVAVTYDSETKRLIVDANDVFINLSHVTLKLKLS